MRRRVRFGALLAGLVAFCLSAAVADPALAAAGGDATIKATTLPVAAGASGGAVATCPPGRRVVGGGVGTTARTVNSDVRVSGPLDETGSVANTNDGDIATSWYANVLNRGGAGEEYKVFALCSATSDAKIKATPLPLGLNSQADAVATCPAGRRVVGGGVGTTATTVDSLVRFSGPLDETGSVANTDDGDIATSWYANVSNRGGAREYKVFALCSATSDATIKATPLRVATGGAVAMCPAGRRVVGGGVCPIAATLDGSVEISGPLDETGLTANIDDGDIARSWYANVSHAFCCARDYKVFALCAADDDGGGAGPGPAGPGPIAPGPAGPGPIAPGPGKLGTSSLAAANPLLSSPALSPRRFRAAGSGASLPAGVGATVSYTLSQAATVRFTVERSARGRRVGASCVRPRRSNRTKKRCTRYLKLAGSFTRQGKAGQNSLRFSGRLGGRTLRPGRYRLVAIATAASGKTSAATRSPFQIMRR